MNILIYKSKIAFLVGEFMYDAGSKFVIVGDDVYSKISEQTDSFHNKINIPKKTFKDDKYFERIY